MGLTLKDLSRKLTFYAGINGGQGAPTRQRMLDFQAATKTVTTNFNTLYINMYDAMLYSGNVVNMLNTDGVHPNDTGHLFIANTIYNYVANSNTGNLMMMDLFVDL